MNNIQVKYCKLCDCAVLTDLLNNVYCDKCKKESLRNASNYYTKPSLWSYEGRK